MKHPRLVHRAIHFLRRVNGLERQIQDARRDLQQGLHDITQTVLQARAEQAHDLQVLQETVNLVARTTTAPRLHPIRILFLIHNISAWASVGPIIRAALQDKRFDVTVASINRNFPGDVGYSGEEKVHDYLHQQDITHLRLGFHDPYQALSIIKAINPDVLFRQSQWDADYEPSLSTHNLAFTRLVTLSYDLGNQIDNVPYSEDVLDSAVDSPWHRACWIVFCTNEFVKEQALRRGRRNGDQFVVTGHPKAQQIREAKPRWPLPERDPRPAHIVWSAHHSIDNDWTRFGLFPKVYPHMLEWARRRPDIDFIFSPHPALLTFLRGDRSPIPQTEVDTFFEEWGRLPNTGIQPEADYLPTMAAADLLVSDSLSMPMEYQLQRVPIIFLEREGHVAFNRMGQYVQEGFHHVHSWAEVEPLAQELLTQPDSLRPVQERNSQLLFGIEHAEQNILNAIVDKYQSESLRTAN